MEKVLPCTTGYAYLLFGEEEKLVKIHLEEKEVGDGGVCCSVTIVPSGN